MKNILTVKSGASRWYAFMQHFAALVLIALALTACGRDDSLKWTEDVLLPDGRTITLTRYQEFKGNYEIGDTPSVSNYWFEFVHPDTGEKVRWEGERTQTSTFLLIHEKDVYFLTDLNYGGYDKFNCPNPPFLLYAHKSNRWERKPLEAIPIKKLKPNMTTDPKKHRETIRRNKFHVTAVESGADRINGTETWRINFEVLKAQEFGCGMRHEWPITHDGRQAPPFDKRPQQLSGEK